MSVVIPAYNEEQRLEIMLEEAVTFLDAEYGRTSGKERGKASRKAGKKQGSRSAGYEILVVNDGSKDKTVDIALAFARKYNLHDILRVCTLERNRGKGGAVTHGFRHVRGAYAIFADADGASKFEDLAKLVKGCEEVSDQFGRSIAVGSRAHLVGSEAVVKVSSPEQRLGKYMLTRAKEICPTKRAHAFFPHASLAFNPACYVSYPRYTVWFQVILQSFSAIHYTIHARRRLDL